MDESIFKNNILEFQFVALTKADAAHVIGLEDKTDEEALQILQEDQEEAVAKLKLAIVYADEPAEAYYEVQSAKLAKRYVDLSKLLQGDQPEAPLMRANYEYKDNDFLEAVMTQDEVAQWHQEFLNGKTMQKERLSNSKGAGVLLLHFRVNFYPRLDATRLPLQDLVG